MRPHAALRQRWSKSAGGIARQTVTPVDTGVNNNTSLSNTSMTLGPFTPPANSLVFVIVNFCLPSSPPTTGISDTSGLTWNEVTAGWVDQFSASGFHGYGKTSVFWAKTGASPSSTTVTVTSSAGCVKTGRVATAANVDPTTPVGTTGSASAVASYGSGSSLTVNTAASPASNSCMFSVWADGTNNSPVNPTEDPGFTHLFGPQAGGTAGGTAKIDGVYKHGGVSSVAWTTSGANDQMCVFQGILMELIGAPV